MNDVDMKIGEISPAPRPLTLRDYVYQLLLERLGTGRYGINKRIIEKDLVDQLDVSRTPVRDALARLAAEGFLVSTKHGYRVPNITKDDIEFMTEMRAIVEPQAAQQAAENDTKTGIAEMHRAISDEETSHRNDNAIGFERAHLIFRSAWLSRVRNPLLLETAGKSLVTLQLIRHIALRHEEIRSHIIESHKGLLEAIEEKSPEKANAIQKKRVLEFHNLLIEHVIKNLNA